MYYTAEPQQRSQPQRNQPASTSQPAASQRRGALLVRMDRPWHAHGGSSSAWLTISTGSQQTLFDGAQKYQILLS